MTTSKSTRAVKSTTAPKRRRSSSESANQSTTAPAAVNLNTTVVLAALVGLLVGVALSSAYWYRQKTKNYMPFDQLSSKIEDFVGNNIFQGQLDVKVKDMQAQNGVAKFTIEIPERGEFPSYVTRDGQLLFPEGIDMDQAAQDQPPVDNQASPAGQVEEQDQSASPTSQTNQQ